MSQRAPASTLAHHFGALVACLALGCTSRVNEEPTSTTDGGSSTGNPDTSSTTTSTTSTTSSTGTSSGAETTGGSTGADLPSGCMDPEPLELCLPATDTEPEWCLRAAQMLREGVVWSTAGDIDADGHAEVVLQGYDTPPRLLQWTGEQLEEVQVYDTLPPDHGATFTYVRSLGALFIVVETGDLSREFHPVGENGMLGSPFELSIPDEGTPWRREALGDFDGDEQVDVVAIARQSVGVETDEIVAYTFSNAATQPTPSEFVRGTYGSPIEGPLDYHALVDLDTDGVDDLWLEYPDRRVYWGESGLGLPTSEQSVEFAMPRASFDANGDGLFEYLTYDERFSYLGTFAVVLGASSRTLEVVDGPEAAFQDILHNEVRVLRLGADNVALALKPAGDIGYGGDSGIAVTSLASFPAIPPWRTRTLSGMYVYPGEAVDIDGDGRDELIATWAAGTEESRQLCVFEVVEGP